MPKSTRDKGKGRATAGESKEEAFSQLLMGGEEDFEGYLKENETLDDDGQLEEEEDDDEEDDIPRSALEPLEEEDQEDDEDDDDNDSLAGWMQEEEEEEEEEQAEKYIDDNEITDLLQNSAAKRAQLKTGGQDELEKDMEEFENNLALTTGIGLKKLSRSARKRAMLGELRLPEEIKRKLGNANGLYIGRDYGAAIDILQSIITDYPNAHPAWNTLGLVHEELGNKAKSLQLRMVAAHMCNDTSLWKELGQKSIENDAIKQAIYCFSKALILDPSDVDALWDRSFLHKQLGRTIDAIAGFNKILEMMPHHFKVINELAQIYRVQGKTKEAIQMYEDAIVYHTTSMEEDEDEEEDAEDEFSDKLGYSEINMLSELYLILNDYRKCLDTIKTGLRHVQKRQNETWWMERNDDDEYLEEDEARTDFPIELRVRMGICRVYLNQEKIATKHFQYLLQYPATTYPDLHQDIAYAYYYKRHYQLAVNLFQKIIDASDEIEVDLLIYTADCYREIGDLDTAVIFYVNVLDEQPENLNVMMSLATVYEEQGKEEEALELVDFVMKKTRENRKLKKADANKDGDEDELTAEEALQKARGNRKTKSKKASIFDEGAHHKSKQEYYRQRQDEIERQNQEMEVTIKGLFERLDEIGANIGSDLVGADRSLIRDYMKSASEVWEDFCSVRAFFPSERSKKFEGFYAQRRSKKTANANNENIDLEAHQMANRLRTRVKTEDMDEDLKYMDDETKSMMEQEESNRRIAAASHFRNISFDTWLSVIIKYAYTLAITRRIEDCYDVLKKASTANVFYFDVQKKTAIRFGLVGCGLIACNEFITQEGMRWLCNFYQFRNDPYRLYHAVINSGDKEANSYASYTQMKYLGRNIRLMDAIVATTRRKENGDVNGPHLEEIQELNDAILAMNVDPSTVSEQDFSRFYQIPEPVSSQIIDRMGLTAPKHANPIMLSLFGHIMNLTRNHIAASLFFMRAYAIAPKDRLTTLSLGLALLQAAMQRKTDNRHLQIMQGMMFVFEYVKLTGHCQETEYNLGRAFHFLGLTHLAVPHYEKALCMPSRAKEGIEDEKPIEEVYTWPVNVDNEYDDMEEEEDSTDLTREAAYNLHCIYITSGSMNLAQILLLKYCSV